MAADQDQTSPMSAWLIGLFLGAIAAVALIGFGVTGVVFTMLFVGLIAWKGPRLAATAGLVTGLGVVWAILFSNVLVQCAQEDATPGSSCDVPGIGVWVAASVGVLLLGVVGTLVAARRLRAR